MMKARRRSGYVLLCVIAASVLLIAVLSKLATLSLRQSLAAADAEVDLRMRWGARSLRRLILTDAGGVFQVRDVVRDPAAPPPPPSIRDSIMLGGVTHDLILGDDNAKLNVNAIYHRGGMTAVDRAIAKVVSPAVLVAVRPLPAVAPGKLTRNETKLSLSDEIARGDRGDSDDLSDDASDDFPTHEPAVPPAFRAPGELFDLSLISATALAEVTDRLTLFGGDAINLPRCQDEVIEAVVGTVLEGGGGERFVRRYRQNPNLPIESLIRREATSRSDRRRLRSLLSESSDTFSLWIASRSSGRGRQVTLTIKTQNSAGLTRQQRFAF